MPDGAYYGPPRRHSHRRFAWRGGSPEALTWQTSGRLRRCCVRGHTCRRTRKDLLAEILNAHSGIPVTTAVDGEAVERRHVYVAPADHHLLVIDGVIRLGRGPRENLARPAVDPLFRSVGLNYGPRAVAIVLTGMLNDGAAGLADLKRCGGVTVVQNPSEAVAPDMPMGALRASDVDYRAPLEDLAALLVELTGEEAGPPILVPAEIRLEVDIALGLQIGSETMLTIANPVPISCPACGGVLSQIRVGRRCGFVVKSGMPIRPRLWLRRRKAPSTRL